MRKTLKPFGANPKVCAGGDNCCAAIQASMKLHSNSSIDAKYLPTRLPRTRHA